MQKQFQARGAELLRMDPAQFRKFIESEMEKWGQVVKKAGITAQ